MSRVGELVPKDAIAALLRDTITKNAQLWLETHPERFEREGVTKLVVRPELLAELVELLTRQAAQSVTLLELDAHRSSLLQPWDACMSVARALSGRPAEEQRRICEAARILAAPFVRRPPRRGGDLDKHELEFAAVNGMADAPAAEVRAAIFAASHVVPPAPPTMPSAPEPGVRELTALQVLAVERGFMIAAAPTDRDHVVIASDDAKQTYEGTAEEVTRWLHQVCPGCRVYAHASETDDNGYHPQCLARVRGAMELGADVREGEPEDATEARLLSEMGAHHTMSPGDRMVPGNGQTKD